MAGLMISNLAELKELNSSLTSEEMSSEIQELKGECASCLERLQKIKSATDHVAPQEREKVSFLCTAKIIFLCHVYTNGTSTYLAWKGLASLNL